MTRKGSTIDQAGRVLGLGLLARVGWAGAPYAGAAFAVLWLLMNARTGSLWLGLVAAVAWVVIPLALLRGLLVLLGLAGREAWQAVRSLLTPNAVPGRLPLGWDGQLFYVYVWWWPREDLLPPTLQGRKLGGRMAYIGRSVDVARRNEQHAADRREFVLPYGRQEVFRVPTYQEMVALERRLIQDADRAGEPIVNVQLHRSRR